MSQASVNAKPVAVVIDDDQDTVDLLEIVLTQAGFAVITASNGPAGIALALEHRPVLATIDVTMPRMNGLEVTRRIRHQAADTYIVIISSRSQEHDVLAGFDAGADDYVPKPIRPRELQARLAAVARRPVEAVAGAAPVAWAPAEEDVERSEYLRNVAAGQSLGYAETEVHGAGEGKDGRYGMLELGMRFVGSWIEFSGLRINPSRELLVIDDRIVDVSPEDFKLIETMLYAGTSTLSWRQLALRYRGETEETSTRSPAEDRAWFDAELEELLSMIGDDHARPRWFRVRKGRLKLVDPTG